MMLPSKIINFTTHQVDYIFTNLMYLVITPSFDRITIHSFKILVITIYEQHSVFLFATKIIKCFFRLITNIPKAYSEISTHQNNIHKGENRLNLLYPLVLIPKNITNNKNHKCIAIFSIILNFKSIM